jgi:hypothetical protein
MAVHPPLEDDVRHRRRYRRIRAAITLVILTGLVVWAAWYAWQVVTEPAATEDDSEPVVQTPVCAVAVPTEAPPPEEISINIYNGTSRNGLASQVAREMREQGYVILDVANDPLSRSITGVAEVRAANAENLAVQLIMSQFPGATFVPDEREDEVIDLVLGEQFEAIGPQDPEPDPESTVEPLPAC